MRGAAENCSERITSEAERSDRETCLPGTEKKRIAASVNTERSHAGGGERTIYGVYACVYVHVRARASALRRRLR